MNKLEIKAEHFDDCVPFDTTVDELMKLMEGECPGNMAMNMN